MHRGSEEARLHEGHDHESTGLCGAAVASETITVSAFTTTFAAVDASWDACSDSLPSVTEEVSRKVVSLAGGSESSVLIIAAAGLKGTDGTGAPIAGGTSEGSTGAHAGASMLQSLRQPR